MNSTHPCFSLFFFNDTATTEIYTLSLHDALPILYDLDDRFQIPGTRFIWGYRRPYLPDMKVPKWRAVRDRSEEHTSELQSHLNLVCRLLLEKKKTCTHACYTPLHLRYTVAARSVL